MVQVWIDFHNLFSLKPSIMKTKLIDQNNTVDIKAIGLRICHLYVQLATNRPGHTERYKVRDDVIQTNCKQSHYYSFLEMV